MIAAPIGNRYAFVRAFSIGSSIDQVDPNGLAIRELKKLCDLVEHCLNEHYGVLGT